jgi:hypothetical protein
MGKISPLGKCIECIGFIDIHSGRLGKLNRLPEELPRRKVRVQLRKKLSKARAAIVIFEGKGICSEHLLDKVLALEI